MNERTPNTLSPGEESVSIDPVGGESSASPAGRTAPPPPDFGRGVSRFFKDEEGQSMVEFCIVMPLFLFLVMGIVQFMLIANASYFVNYGNFMALRTATAHWEMSPVGVKQGKKKASTKIPSNVKSEAKKTLQYCLLPVAWFKGDIPTSLAFLLQAKVNLNLAKSTNTGNKVDWLEGWSRYDYPLMIPLASNIIHAIAGGKQGSDDYYADVLPYTANTNEILGIPIPDELSFLTQLTLRIHSDSSYTGDAKKGGKKKSRNPHRMLIQRRW